MPMLLEVPGTFFNLQDLFLQPSFTVLLVPSFLHPAYPSSYISNTVSNHILDQV